VSRFFYIAFLKAMDSMGLFNKLFGKKQENPDKRLSPIDYNKYFDSVIIENMPLRFLNLGEVALPTGKIVACDPLVCLDDTLPFIETVNPGMYPVIACIADVGKAHERYAIVKLEFSKSRATKWELAVTEGQEIGTLNEDDAYFGFPVDAGLGCFCDLETQKLYNEFEAGYYQRHPDGGGVYSDLLEPKFKENAVDPNDPLDAGDWLNFYLPNKPELNVIMFHSGWGDGMYPCYWGKTDKGEICSLVVDFLVF
jgi:hypothetical protein